MELREATPEDAAAVRRVHRASIRRFGPDAYDGEQVAAWARGCDSADYASSIASADVSFVVAVESERVVGFGSARLAAPDGYEADVDAEVTAVYVAPGADGAGVGTALLRRLERDAREAGARRQGLTSSLNAVGFYERHGYERVRERRHEFSADEGTDVYGRVVEMRKELG